MIDFGKFKISAHNHGFFRLDGGAMFGSVPKNLWSRLIKPDEENCIPLATRSILIEVEDRKILVDVGCGDKMPAKLNKIFAIKNTPEDELGFDRKAVTDVILTHLHFDHGGGISRFKDNSPDELELVYPQAQVFIQKDNYLNAKNPNIRERASYLKENIDILESGDLKLVDGSTEIFPDIWVHPIHGHTTGQQYLEIRHGTERIYYVADLIPTSRHLPLPFHMGYDMCAGTVIDEKEKFLEKALSENALIIFEHDPDTEAGYLAINERGHYCLAKKVTI